MPAPTPAVNTFELQRLIREAEDLSTTESCVLLTITTYYPHACPSRATLAKGCKMHPESLRRTLAALESKGWLNRNARLGRTTVLTVTPPNASLHPPIEDCTPQRLVGAPNARLPHPPIEDCPEETRKRQDQDKTRQDTEISHVATPSEEPVRPAGQVDKGEAKTSASDTTTSSAPRSAAQKLAAWSDVWEKVLGPKAGPLPSVGQLKTWRADCTEAIFSSTLADVASSVAQGKVSEPRALFRANLRTADPKAPAWTREQVCAIVDPAAPTPRPASRNPAYQPVVVRERQRPMNAEEKKAAMALIAKARRELMGEGATA